MLIAAPGNANSRAVVSHRAHAGQPALFFVGTLPRELPAGAVRTADEPIGPPEWWLLRRQPPGGFGGEWRLMNVRLPHGAVHACGASVPPPPGGRDKQESQRLPHTAQPVCSVPVRRRDR